MHTKSSLWCSQAPYVHKINYVKMIYVEKFEKLNYIWFMYGDDKFLFFISFSTVKV